MGRGEPRAVLVTGVYGSGKTSVAEEIADLVETRGLPYALLDLDYLVWFEAGDADERAAERIMLANLSALVGNYLTVGVRFFILAGAIRDRSGLDRIKAGVGIEDLTVPNDRPIRQVATSIVEWLGWA